MPNNKKDDTESPSGSASPLPSPSLSATPSATKKSTKLKSTPQPPPPSSSALIICRNKYVLTCLGSNCFQPSSFSPTTPTKANRSAGIGDTSRPSMVPGSNYPPMSSSRLRTQTTIHSGPVQLIPPYSSILSRLDAWLTMPPILPSELPLASLQSASRTTSAHTTMPMPWD